MSQKSGFNTEGSSRKLPRTNKNVIIETNNQKIYSTQKLKVELKGSVTLLPLSWDTICSRFLNQN